MPITRSAYQDTLRMRFDFGEDEEGNRVQRTRSYTRVKHTANDEAIFDLADGFEKLFEPVRVNVLLQDAPRLGAAVPGFAGHSEEMALRLCHLVLFDHIHPPLARFQL